MVTCNIDNMAVQYKSSFVLQFHCAKSMIYKRERERERACLFNIEFTAAELVVL